MAVPDNPGRTFEGSNNYILAAAWADRGFCAGQCHDESIRAKSGETDSKVPARNRSRPRGSDWRTAFVARDDASPV